MVRTLLEWAKRSTHKCPDCNWHTRIPQSWIKITCWCPVCQTIWQLRGNNSGKVYEYYWHYVTNEGKKLGKTKIRKQK